MICRILSKTCSSKIYFGWVLTFWRSLEAFWQIILAFWLREASQWCWSEEKILKLRNGELLEHQLRWQWLGVNGLSPAGDLWQKLTGRKNWKVHGVEEDRFIFLDLTAPTKVKVHEYGQRAQDTLIWSIWIYLLEFIFLDWFGVICWQKLTVRKNWKVHTGRRRTYWSGLSGTSHPQMHNALKNFQRPEAKIWIRFKLQYSLYSSNNKLVWTFRFHVLCHVLWFGSSLGRSFQTIELEKWTAKAL